MGTWLRRLADTITAHTFKASRLDTATPAAGEADIRPTPETTPPRRLFWQRICPFVLPSISVVGLLYVSVRLAMNPSKDILLNLGVFVACAILLGIATGFTWPRLYLWKWADPIYYLLAIAGVILLFVGNERQQQASNLRLNLTDTLTNIQQHEQTSPGNIGEVGERFLDSIYGGINSERELGEACRNAHSSDGGCIAAVERLTPITNTFTGYQLPTANATSDDKAVALLGFCERSRKLLDTLLQSDPAFQKLGVSLRKVADLHAGPMQWEESNNLQQAMLQELGHDLDVLLTQTPEVDRPLAKAFGEGTIRFAGQLHWALSVCIRVPEDAVMRAGSRADWQEQDAKLHDDAKTLQVQIAILGSGEGSGSYWRLWLDFVWRSFWSFVLVAALSLKLAKAIASIRT